MATPGRRDRQGNTAETPVPIWILAPYEEKLIRAECQERTNNICANKFFRMGECTAKHQLLFSWYCADQKKELLDCVAHWGSKDQYEKLREIYIEKKRAELIKEEKI